MLLRIKIPVFDLPFDLTISLIIMIVFLFIQTTKKIHWNNYQYWAFCKW